MMSDRENLFELVERMPTFSRNVVRINAEVLASQPPGGPQIVMASEGLGFGV